MSVKVFVEIPQGSKNKYELNEDTGEIELDRALHGPHYFPFEYGFIKETIGEDDDPLDVVLLTTHPTFPGCVVDAEIIGYLEMEDESGVDHKVVAVPQAKINPRWKHVQDISDVPEHQRMEIKEFFETYKNLEQDKWVKVQEFKPKPDAERILQEAQERYTSNKKDN